jgi:hypothetical protein
LASIIGSGFLVLGPILNSSYGLYAPAIMLALCAVAAVFGAAIRFNIATLAHQGESRPQLETRLETAASWTLAFSYTISVAYYLNLFGAFGVSMTAADTVTNARMLTSAVLILILIVGVARGFNALEHLEQISVGLKLAIIVGLLTGLVFYFAEQSAQNALRLNPPSVTLWGGATLAFGLIITVQGFETSRYLGDTYDADTRIRSMRLAQWLSAAVYMAYVLLLAYVFPPGEIVLRETAIIDLMAIVAPILPLLLVAAALSAQFSAAIADTSGAGGLIEELTHNRLAPHHGYMVLVAVGLMLTWTTDVFQIISYASRAFAAYYGLQSAIAATSAYRLGDKPKTCLFGAATLLAALIVIFGRAVE